MLLVRGAAGGTALTGTVYEEGEEPPQFSGSPDGDAPYVWVCDEFYEVDSGGSSQVIDGQEIQVAFESPMPRGFSSKHQALEAAREHVRTQFARLGIEPEAVATEVIEVEKS
ncbi:hypothetical protein SAMN05216226_102215 [Halovenus aranensis]|uniref:Uncharacterized protein n=1 Tax=Halovenus aranensis TaxID=890420 RepID=A0A1G8SYK0_9EURY|nr:hypothetical protein [Halovenus aranensis]SDJ34246.1 hypothetical protein SAMN05216226_102215 [Halovenus aranensis]